MSRNYRMRGSFERKTATVGSTLADQRHISTQFEVEHPLTDPHPIIRDKTMTLRTRPLVTPLVLAVTLAAVAWSAIAKAQRAAPWVASSQPLLVPGVTPGPALSTPAPDQAEPEGKRAGAHIERPDIGVLVSTGFPRPLAIEALLKFEQTLALGAEYSVFPTTSISGVKARSWALAADARVFPLRGPFFFGLRAGRQHLSGDASATIPGRGTVSESMQVDTTFLNPRMGLLWTWKPGVTLGVNMGVQIPMSSSTTSTLPAGTSASQQAASIADTLGNSTIPTIDLLQLGVLL
jgi:hypothetical protein